MKFLQILILNIIFGITIFGQNLAIKGIVVDSSNNSPLVGANVVLMDQKNSDLVGVSTNANGQFVISQVTPGRYSLKITFVGYVQKIINVVIYSSTVDLKVIKLSPTPVNLDEVEVEGKAILAIQNKDTTEFLADAVKTNKDASAEELVTKLPGVTVQDGKVQAQGEEVKTILVDGKQFFGDDPNAVLRNIPAEVIERIQIFDKQSEQAEFTGFDDGNTTKTINIITRLRFRDGTFGKLAAGYGNESKYIAGGNVNYFNNNQKITLLGQINNINEQNFSSEDLLGVMGESSSRRGGFVRPMGGRGGRGGGPGGPGGSPGGPSRDISDFLVDTKNGLAVTKATGLNYTDQWFEKVDFNMSYFFNRTDNNADTKLERQYLISTLKDQKYYESNLSNTRNINHRFNMRLEYKIDSMNSIIFRPRFSYQGNDGFSKVFGNTVNSTSDLNKIKNDFSSLLDAYNFSSNLLYRYRFETRGRTLSLNLNTNFRKNTGDNSLYSENIYFDTTGVSDTLDQFSNLDKKSISYSANLSYTEPLIENSLLQLSATFSNNDETSDLNSFRKNSLKNIYNIDTMLSNVYKKNFITQNYGISFQYRLDEISVDAGLNYNISILTNNQTFPRSFEMRHRFYSFLPSIRIRYSITRNNYFQFNYRTSNNEPSVEQLQEVLDNSNPLQLSIGNPDLSQDYRHNFSLRYANTNPETFTSLFIMLNGTYTKDYITTSTIIAENTQKIYKGILLNPGTQLRIPENMDNYYSLRSMIVYGMQISWLKSNLNLNLGTNLSRTPGKINDIINYSHRNSYDAGFVLSSNISKEFDFNISASSSYNTVKNTARTGLNQKYFNHRIRTRLFWMIAYGFLVSTDFEFRRNEAISTRNEPNSYFWNISFGKKFFANDQGELKITVYDVLNKNLNNQRTANDLYIETSDINVLGRYFLVTFSYNLRAF